MPGKMYTDFLESAPIRKPCPNGPEGATRLYVEVTCPQCNKVFVDIPSESLRTCKASRCKRHLDRVHGEGTAMELEQLSNTTKKYSSEELEALIDVYNRRLRKL